MFEGIKSTSKEQIFSLCQENNIEVVNNCADLTHMDYEGTKTFLDKLVSTGNVVLHGTNSEEVYDCLETRQGHCVLKESGRKNAVYATQSSLVTLGISVLNRKHLNQIVPGYSSGFSSVGDVIKFTFPKEIVDSFMAKDPALFSDGYVYVLDKTKFTNAEDAGGEWHSESDQEPLLACKISSNIAGSIYKTEGSDANIDVLVNR